MNTNNKPYLLVSKIQWHRSMKLVFGLALFAMLCLLPIRMLMATMLFIFLMLLIDKVSMVPGESAQKGGPMRNEDYELAKVKWKSEIEHNQDLETTSIKRKIKSKNIAKKRGRVSSNKTKANGDFRKAGTDTEYELAKRRWRREIRDKQFERRVRNLFSRIRESELDEYQRGIEEIRHLLITRCNSLADESASKK
ncbi:MAG: hypothetical protein GY866_33385 [Proteobacteria bacterium]|nr:hypothetical protein [Pseudomonadota bacterium]